MTKHSSVICLVIALSCPWFGGLQAAERPPISSSGSNTFPVRIRVDAAQPKGPLHPIWRFFGADEPNYATMKNGKKLIGELVALGSKNIYFRAHNLLTSV